MLSFKLILIFTAIVCHLNPNESKETTTSSDDSDEDSTETSDEDTDTTTTTTTTEEEEDTTTTTTTTTPPKVVIHPVAHRPKPQPPRGKPPHLAQRGAKNGQIRPQPAHSGGK